MNVTVIGGGYVGVVTATIFAKLYGHHVVCVETDTAKLADLQQGVVPFYEPKIQPLIYDMITKSRLLFVSSLVRPFGQVQVIAVGTPANPDGSTDLSGVISAVTQIAERMESETVIVIKSTVPPGTCMAMSTLVADILARREVDYRYSVVSNPEFLREGSAVDDAMTPSRIVIGTSDQYATNVMTELYQSSSAMLFMDVSAAELTKYVSNAMLASRIAIVNQVANLAEVLKIDVRQVLDGVGADSRIGHQYMEPGIGYGGSCFPKDIQSIVQLAESNGSSMSILRAVHEANVIQPSFLQDRIIRRFGDDLVNCRFAIWGVSFKPETDDMRDAPSLPIIKFLIDRGATVVINDPQALFTCNMALMNVLSEEQMKRVEMVDDSVWMANGADALLVLTEWNRYIRFTEWSLLHSVMRTSCIFDGRNVYDRLTIEAEGFEYYGIGQGQLT